MGQRTLASRVSSEPPGPESRQERFHDPMEQTAAWIGPLPPAEACYPKPANGLQLAWRGVMLCNSFLHRWFNIYDCGAEAALYLYASPLLRCFAGTDSDRAAVRHESSAPRFRDILERRGLSRPGDFPSLPGRQPELDISWRSPWLYVSLLLLALLLAL
jgi:hypothetical protein